MPTVHSPVTMTTSSREASSNSLLSPIDPTSPTKPLLWKLYLSHTLSTWNARTFEFGAVIFLAAVFPGTLFFASCYALFRSAAAALLGSWVGSQVDRGDRLYVVRQSIVWQRLSVAASCLMLLVMLSGSGREEKRGVVTYALFAGSVVLACVEKLAFVANTVSIERDWVVVVADSLHLERQDLNSTMRRIDLVCKLLAPVGIGLIDGYSTNLAIWIVFGQNALSVLAEYFAIAHVYASIPALASRQSDTHAEPPSEEVPAQRPPRSLSTIMTPHLTPWTSYFHNPAFLASFSLSTLYLTVLSFSSQMTTYLLTLGYTSTHVSLLRLASVLLELSATCAAPWLMARIGAVRAGLWFINQQLLSAVLAVTLFSWASTSNAKLAGAALVLGVCLSRLGLWGFDLSVQFVVQDSAPEGSRGSFSATEMALQNVFELVSFALTVIFYRPEDFRVPVYVSVGAVALSASCFAGFVRKRRGHLLHTDRCLKGVGRKRGGYRVLETIAEDVELESVRMRESGSGGLG